MLRAASWAILLAGIGATAQDDTTTTTQTTETSTTTAPEFSFTNSYVTLTGTQIPSSDFIGSQYVYLSPTGQSTVKTYTTNGTLATATDTAINTQITVSSRSVDVTVIGALPSNSTATSNATSTSTAAQPSNTVPCNGFPEFCNRKYSNITMVAAHNAAFVVKNNAASNQAVEIPVQLQDGIRMLTGEVHWENNTLWNCHTSCTELNAGTWQSELETVADWLGSNRLEVLTILIVNSDFRPVTDFVAPLTNAGLLQYLYEPAYVPQYRSQWPTLGEMILTNKRLVVFMDYKANQTEVPYILDEFTHIWETPFSPTDPEFPCTQQRPPKLNQTLARDEYMYLANHNLNVAVDLSSAGITTAEEILIPNTAQINETNGSQNETQRLGQMSLECQADWGRPPNFLLVDYYNYGSPEPCSVFQVAARANNVTYTETTCGVAVSAAPLHRASVGAVGIATLIAAVLSL